MAQVLAPFGIHGWIKIRPFTASPDALLAYQDWWLKPSESQAWREVSRLAGRVHSDTVLAQLAGVDSRETALTLRGAEIGMPRGSLPPVDDDEIYWADLVGLEVVNREGVVLGRVVAVQDFGAQPILRVAPAENSRRDERLIPFVPAYVDRVDLSARRIEVDWLPDY
jgi:16S rRNA processing protein RimM